MEILSTERWDYAFPCREKRRHDLAQCEDPRCRFVLKTSSYCKLSLSIGYYESEFAIVNPGINSEHPREHKLGFHNVAGPRLELRLNYM